MLKRTATTLIAVVVSAILLLTAQTAFAQDPLGAVCTGSGASSAACQSRTTDNPLLGANGILTKVVQIVVMITAVASVIMIMVGGFQYITSTGDSAKINKAKDTILYAIIGLVVAVIAQSIVSFVLQRL